MTQPLYNYSAGPAVMPQPVLKEAQARFLNYEQSGMSVMELSHRSVLFERILADAQASLRRLMAIPDNYNVLFLQGGASLQFSMIPLNLATTKRVAYIDSGSWSEKAIAEAKKHAEVTILASSAAVNYNELPQVNAVEDTYDYVHITTNNTIEGTAFLEVPNIGDNSILVADMSSNILSSNYNVTDFGMIYAGAQKNIGPAGVTVVIIREDLIKPQPLLPTMLSYETYATANSMYNTPPTFAIYMAKLVLEWLEAEGGVAEMAQRNREKAMRLYQFIDESAFYTSPVIPSSRSLMNIPFLTASVALDKQFIQEATAAGLVNLEGHRSVGGMRASLYNAMPLAGVDALIEFMRTFAQKNQLMEVSQ